MEGDRSTKIWPYFCSEEHSWKIPVFGSKLRGFFHAFFAVKVILSHSHSLSLHCPLWARKPYQLFIFFNLSTCTNHGHLIKNWHLSNIFPIQVLVTHNMMVWHFNVHLLANALDSACLCCSGEISWLTPANIFKRGHNMIYLLENLNSKIWKLLRSRFARDLYFPSCRDRDLHETGIWKLSRSKLNRDCNFQGCRDWDCSRFD